MTIATKLGWVVLYNEERLLIKSQELLILWSVLQGQMTN